MSVTARRLPQRHHPHRAREGAARRSHAAVGRVLRAGAPRHAGRRAVLVPAQRPVADLHRARPRRPGVGRRRQRVPRLPQRLRRHVRRARQPHHRRRRQGAGGPGHALRGAHRGLDRGGRGAQAALGPPPLALHQLRHRVDDGRRPPRARPHRARRDREDRGHLPRPPRRRDGLGQAAAGPDGRARAPRRDPLRPGLRARDRRGHPCHPLQRRRGGRACARAGRRRRPDRRAGDDEHQHRQAGRGLPRAPARAVHPARRAADLRRGQDRRGGRRRRRDRAVRRHARHRLPREGDLRRAPRRRGRHDRRHSPSSSSPTPSASRAPSTATRS